MFLPQQEFMEFIHCTLTKVDVIPAQAPAASLPKTESSPSFPLKSLYKTQNETVTHFKH